MTPARSREFPVAATPAQVTTTGEMARRIALSFERLERYDLSDTFSGNGGWPADREGRVILAQTLISQAAHRPSVHLDGQIVEAERRLNAAGYLGEVLPEGLCDEQVLSGHSWLLRGLCEYHTVQGDARSRQLVEAIVHGLLLPLKGRYPHYPLGLAGRALHGEAAGTLTTGIVDAWRLSTDIGCAFIMLDGATAAWELVRSPDLAVVIEEMIARFREFDPVAVSAQTHATLSAARGLLRWSRLTGQDQLVALAQERYALYARTAQTDAFGNWNWFGRPLWTEPCAIVDAFEVAYQLWELTGTTSYLDDAHEILHNALAYAQRPNGGFGCDSCVGGDGSPVLTPFSGAFEAPWCCTMRGAVGLARAASFGWSVAGSVVSLPLLHAATATLGLPEGAITLERSGSYPHEGLITIRLIASAAGVSHVRLRIFLPSWVPIPGVRLHVDGQAAAVSTSGRWLLVDLPGRVGARVEVEMPMALRSVEPMTPAMRPGRHGLRHGALVLGLASAEPVRLPRDAVLTALGRGRYRLPDGRILGPLTDGTFQSEEQARADARCVLFTD